MENEQKNPLNVESCVVRLETLIDLLKKDIQLQDKIINTKVNLMMGLVAFNFITTLLFLINEFLI